MQEAKERAAASAQALQEQLASRAYARMLEEEAKELEGQQLVRVLLLWPVACACAHQRPQLQQIAKHQQVEQQKAQQRARTPLLPRARCAVHSHTRARVCTCGVWPVACRRGAAAARRARGGE